MICVRCGRDNPNQLTFCQDCGQRLLALAQGASKHPLSERPKAPALSFEPSRAAEQICSECGARSPLESRFCVSCGARLHSQAAVETAPFPATPAPSAEPPQPLPLGSTRRQERPPELELRPRLTTITVDGSEGATHLLDADQVDLGREEGKIILPSDLYLSPRHARFILRKDGWSVRDLGSVNGVYIRLSKPAPLVDGDLLLAGLQVLKFALVNGAEQALEPATQHGTLVFGSPVFPRYARLSQRTVEGVTRNVFYLHKDETTIGRESGDVVFSDDPFLSRRHLMLRRDALRGTFTIEDLDSSNGTYLAIRRETRLENGARLRIGQHIFRFDLGPARGESAGRVA